MKFMFGGVIIYLFFFALSLFIAYLIIKTAVKHAIAESQENIRSVVRKGVVDAFVAHDNLKNDR